MPLSTAIYNTLVAQSVKNLRAMQETQVQSLGWEDPLVKEVPLQSSCLENSMDKGAWWATVHGVAKSQMQLIRLGLWFLVSQSFPFFFLIYNRHIILCEFKVYKVLI